jgi:small subunit ribosomal protein S18
MARERTEERERTPRSKREPIIKRNCTLCEDQVELDYKQTELLKKFLTERGKILPSRLTGNCAKHQRALATAIKRARVMLFLR